MLSGPFCHVAGPGTVAWARGSGEVGGNRGHRRVTPLASGHLWFPSLSTHRPLSRANFGLVAGPGALSHRVTLPSLCGHPLAQPQPLLWPAGKAFCNPFRLTLRQSHCSERLHAAGCVHACRHAPGGPQLRLHLTFRAVGRGVTADVKGLEEGSVPSVLCF